MLITTTSSIIGQEIKEYRGIVFGEAINVMFFVKDFTTSMMRYSGGRADEYEEELVAARASALKEMMLRAQEVGANAVIGVSVDCEIMQASTLLVTAYGTAVVI